MSGSTFSSAQGLRWKLPTIGFVIGLVLGPLISGALGWQVRTTTLRQQVEQAIVREQAEMCEMLARRNAENLAELDFGQRVALAEKYAKFPWDDTVSTAVVNRCSNNLGQDAGSKAEDDKA